MSDNTFESITAAIDEINTVAICPTCKEREVDVRVSMVCEQDASLMCRDCWVDIGRPLILTATVAERTGAIMLHASCGAELHSVDDLIQHMWPDWLPGREPKEGDDA